MGYLKARIGWRSAQSNDKGNIVNNLTVGQYAHAGVILGSGTSAAPCLGGTTSDKNFLSFYLSSAATTGTTRGMYLRTYLTAGAGGEALRVFNTVSSNTPADTVNGAHISLNFGASAGNVTGLGTAARCTVHVPNRALTGTGAAVQAEFFSDGASSDISGKWAGLRIVNNGNATGIGKVDDAAYALSLSGFTAGAGNLISALAGEPTWVDKTLQIRCWDETAGRAFYLVAVIA